MRYRLSIDLIKNKKKNAIKFISILSVLFVLIFIVFPLFQGIEANLTKSYQEKYGEQHLIVYDVALGEKEVLWEKRDEARVSVKKLGTITSYGNFEICGVKTTATIGYFDETTMEITHIKLKEGHFPKTRNEVVLENNLFLQLPIEMQESKTLSIEVDGETVFLQIVGIVYDYVTNWDTLLDVQIKPGENDIPRVLVAKDFLREPIAEHMVVQMDTIDDLAAINSFNPLWRKISSYQNEMTYNRLYGTLKYEQSMMARVQQVFFVMMLFGSAYIVFVATKAYYSTYANAYERMYTLGAEGDFPFRCFLYQHLSLLGISLGIGTLLGITISFLSKKILQVQAPLRFVSNEIIFSICLFVIIALLAGFICFWQSIYRLRGKSISENDYEKKQGKRMHIKGSLQRGLSRFFIQNNWKRISLVLLLLSMIFCGLLLLGEYFSFEMTTLREGSGDFSMDADGSVAFMPYHYFQLFASMENAFSIEESLALKEMDGIEEVDIRWDSKGTLIVPTTKSDYWNIQAEYSLYATQEVYVKDAPRDIVGVVAPSYQIVLIDETNQEAIQEKYPEISKKVYEGNAVALFCPTITKGKETLRNDVFQTGGEISFGYLTLKEGAALEEMIYDVDSAEYHENTLMVGTILEETFTLAPTAIGEDDYENIKPTILLSKETAKQLPFIIGAWHLEIYLEDNINETTYQTIEDTLRLMNAQLSRTSFFSLREERIQVKERAKVLYTSILLFVIIYGGAFVLSFAMVLSLQINKRKRSLAIFRALGMRRKTLFGAMLREMFVYFMIMLFLFAVVGGVLGAYLNAQFFFGDVYWYIVDIPRFLSYLIYPAVLFAIIFFATAVLLSRNTYQHLSIQTLQKE